MGRRDRSNSRTGSTASASSSGSSTSGGGKSKGAANGGTLPDRGKDELWRGSIVKDIGDGAAVQIVGMGSAKHTVYARVIPSTSSDDDGRDAADDASPPLQVAVGKVVETMVEEEWRRLVKAILEKGEHIDSGSHPAAKELLRLGAVWLVNETAYSQGKDMHSHLLKEKDESSIPDWKDMTIRVHYMPDRFYMAHEVDWAKYCRGLLIGGTVEVDIGGDRPPVPTTKLPDLKDGTVVYEDADLGYAILNKPGGVPCHATKSNHAENVVAMFHEALKELWPANHRKIHVTMPQRFNPPELHGLIAVSTRKEFSAYYADLLEPKRKNGTTAKDKPFVAAVAKRYRCLVCIKDDEKMNEIESFAQSGTVISHFEDVKSLEPKKFARFKPKSGGREWMKCQMRIKRVGNDRLRAACITTPDVPDGISPDSTLAHRLWGTTKSANPAKDLGAKYVMDLEVELLSWEQSRPHQLRGQLAALGCPIVGDTLYGGGTCETGGHRHTWNRMAVQCCEISFPEPKWEDVEGEDNKKLVSSDRMCRFRLHEAWWSVYMDHYNMTV